MPAPAVAFARRPWAYFRVMARAQPRRYIDTVRLRARLHGCRAAVLVTHDVADALDLQARVLLMRDGRIVADGQADRMAAGEHGEWPAQFMRQALLAPAVSGFRAPGGNLMSR